MPTRRPDHRARAGRMRGRPRAGTGSGAMPATRSCRMASTWSRETSRGVPDTGGSEGATGCCGRRETMRQGAALPRHAATRHPSGDLVGTYGQGCPRTDVPRQTCLTPDQEGNPESGCGHGWPRAKVPRQTCLAPDQEGHPEGRCGQGCPRTEVSQHHQLSTVMTDFFVINVSCNDFHITHRRPSLTTPCYINLVRFAGRNPPATHV